MNRNILLTFSLGVLFFISACGDPPKKVVKETSKVIQESKQVLKIESKSEKVQLDDSEAQMTPKQLAKAKEILASVGAKDLKDIDGSKLFKTNCTLCHGFKGDANINGAKDLTASKIDAVNAVAQVYFGKGLMTPYKEILSEAEIVAVVNFTSKLREN